MKSTLTLLHYTKDSTGQEYVVFSEDGDAEGNTVPGYRLYAKTEIEAVEGDFRALPIDVSFHKER